MITGRITRVISVALLLALAGIVRADTGPLTLHSGSTGGGGTLSAGEYRLVGAIGQPVAGALQMEEYGLTSGVVTPSIMPDRAKEQVYLPLVRH